MASFRQAVCLVLLSLAPAIGGRAEEAKDAGKGPEGLRPCDATVTQHPDRLLLSARVVKNLGLERPPVTTGGQPVVRMIVFPGWADEAEWALSVYLPEDGPAVVEGVVARRGIRASNFFRKKSASDSPSFEVALTPQPLEVKTRSFKKNLERETATRLRDAFLTFIKGARFTVPETLVLHGTTYHFVAWESGLGFACSQAVSPEAGTRPHSMVELGTALLEYAKATAKKQSEALQKLAAQLQAVAP